MKNPKNTSVINMLCRLHHSICDAEIFTNGTFVYIFLALFFAVVYAVIRNATGI